MEHNLHIRQGNVRVGVGVFIFRSHDDRRFLLGLRKGSIGAGAWSLAGGHLECGETFEQCTTREVKEETGLDVEHVEFLTAIESFFQAESKHYVTILTTAVVKAMAGSDIPEAIVMEPEKCEGWSWISFAEMRQMADNSGSDLFLPLVNLLAQRPEICSELERKEVPT